MQVLMFQALVPMHLSSAIPWGGGGGTPGKVGDFEKDPVEVRNSPPPPLNGDKEGDQIEEYEAKVNLMIN